MAEESTRAKRSTAEKKSLSVETAAGGIPSLHATPAAASVRELGWAAFVLAVGLWLLIKISQAEALVVRDFWLDEICTLLLTTDHDFSHMLSALLHGADSNPPALHVTLWAMHSVGIPLNEITLRLFSWLTVWGGLVGLYACLRSAFNSFSSAAGIAMVIGTNVFARQLFEARFYGPWLCICAWLCFALLRRRAGAGGRAGRINQVLLAILSVLMCTIHYFGVISFGLIVGADLITDSGTLWQRVRTRWPLGFAALAAPLLGYFYVHQSAALTVKTWVPPATWQQDAVFLQETLNFFPLAIMAGLLVLAWAWMYRRRIPVYQAAAVRMVRPLSGLFALALLPIVLVGFSHVAQSVEISRYAFPALLGVAGLTAWMCSRLHTWVAIALTCVLLVMAEGYLRLQGFQAAYGTAELRAIGMTLEEKTADTELIVCEQRHDLYPLTVYFEKMRPRLYFLDFRTGEYAPGALVPSVDFCTVERDANRVVAGYYPQIQFCTEESLAAHRPPVPFVLIAVDEDIARIRLRFPHAIVQQRVGRIFEVVFADIKTAGE